MHTTKNIPGTNDESNLNTQFVDGLYLFSEVRRFCGINAETLIASQYFSRKFQKNAAIQRFGRIDILVNNAGIVAAPGWEERERPSEEDWDMIYAVNVKGVAGVTESVVPHMKRRRYGKIVNIASIAGRLGSRTSAPYSASKASVINMTQNFALDLAEFNINVNSICPGLLWTPMWQRIATRYGTIPGDRQGLPPREVFDRHVKQVIPMGREQTPEDVGHAVAFLASDYAKNITGQALNVSGGSHMN